MKILYNDSKEYGWSNKNSEFSLFYSNIISRKFNLPRSSKQTVEKIKQYTDEINHEFIEITNGFEQEMNGSIVVYVYKPLHFKEEFKTISIEMWFNMMYFFKDKMISKSHNDYYYSIRDKKTLEFVRHGKSAYYSYSFFNKRLL